MPLDPLNPFAGVFGNAPLPYQQPLNQQPPPLQPEEESSILNRIGAAGLGGLSFVGGILNKPGRVVRGLLGGTPQEALNVIPFSDALGITHPEDEVRGTDLLRKMGITRNSGEDPGFFSPEGLAGFGVDVLTDPLTYMSFGGHALTKLGTTAKKAGFLPKTVAERAAGLSGEAADQLANRLGTTASEVAGKPLGGHVGFGLPFGSDQMTFDLSGAGGAVRRGLEGLPGGQAVSSALGAGANAVKNFYTATVPPLFQGSVSGRTTEVGQEIARNINARMPEVVAQSRRELMPLAEHAVANGLEGTDAARAIRQAAETGTGAFPEIVNPLNQLDKRNIDIQRAAGVPAHELAPQVIRQGPGEGQLLPHMERHITAGPDNLIRDQKNLLPTKTPGRLSSLTGLTTESINEMAEKDLGALSRTDLNPAQQAELLKKNPIQQVQQTILDKYLNGAAADQAVEQARMDLHAHKVSMGGVITDQDIVKKLTAAEAERAALRSQAQQLAEMKVNGRLPTFLNHPVADALQGNTRALANVMKSEELYKGLAKAAVAPGEDTVSVMDAIKRFWDPSNTMGESVTDAAGNLIGHMPAEGATINMQKALKEAGFQGGVFDAHIPRHVADDIAGFAQMHTMPGTSMFAKVWDNITNFTKAFQTFTPSTVLRNATQDVFNKIAYGLHDPSFAALDPRRYTQPMSDFMHLANGGTVEGLAEKLKGVKGFAGMTDEQAAQEFRRLHSAWDVSRDAFKRTAIKEFGADVGSASEQGLRGLLPTGSQQNPFSAYVGGMKEGSFAPKDITRISGVGGSTEDVFAPVKAMRSANNASDNIMRGSSFLASLEQGNEPAQAFANMMKAHYDFANMSQFERSIMRRAVPFYSWARQNIPATITEIATNPGGKLATVMKGVERAKGENPGFVPPYIREGVAAPIGGEDDQGNQRFLTHLGLGFEDLGQILGPGGPLGMLNPLIKAPFEAATGKQLFTGRDLRDLHSRIGDLTGQPLPALENVAMNSPIGRTLSVAGTLADERKTPLDKAVNLMTGARLSDVNTGAARVAALRDYIQNNLRGPAFRHFDELSVNAANLPLLSPEEMQLYRLYRALNNGSLSPMQNR